MSLNARLDAFKADFKRGAPPYFAPAEMHAVIERATVELIASGQAGRALKAGEIAPGFTLYDADGRAVSSASLLSRGPLVLSFYRGTWCPYCNLELHALQAMLPAYRSAGANLVAISPQLASKAQRPGELSFPILSDPHNDLAARFGLRFALPDYLVALYRVLGNDLRAFNGDDSWTLPIPARYVVAPDGRILYAEVNPDYSQRSEPDAILPILRHQVAAAQTRAL